jgi:SAM-dependent methyltransferase
MLEITVCPVCDSSEWHKVFEVADYSISKEQFVLLKCAKCAFVVTSPQPTRDNLPKYYQSENYISHSGSSNGLVNFIYLHARRFSLRWKLNILKALKPAGALLDVGCGTGEFLKTMKDDNWRVNGVEPSDLARKKAEVLIDQPLSNSVDQVNGQYDIITLWHVLEHMPALNDSFSQIKKLLKDNGRLTIAVPNHLAADAQKYQENWAGYDVPRHLWHFSQPSMVLFLQKHGLTLEKTIPMKLDAYYVSLLSEKYKNGESSSLAGLINGFVSGLTSNRKARKSGEYSSLIYIARK